MRSIVKYILQIKSLTLRDINELERNRKIVRFAIIHQLRIQEQFALGEIIKTSRTNEPPPPLGRGVKRKKSKRYISLAKAKFPFQPRFLASLWHSTITYPTLTKRYSRGSVG